MTANDVQTGKHAFGFPENAKRMDRTRSFAMNALAYFLRPFPSRKGFSAYRFPGLAAHVPFFVALSLSGLLLCGVKPLLLVWVLGGLYLGRDVAIICHYALILLPAIWAAMFVVLGEAKRIELFGQRHPAAGMVLTVVLLLVLLTLALRSAGAMAGEKKRQGER